MIDFIPLDRYAFVVNTTILIGVLMLSLMVSRHPYAVVERPSILNQPLRMVGMLALVLLCLLIGLRPISYAFGDMGTYYKHFLTHAAGASPEGNDILFGWLSWTFAQFNAPALFFLFCALVYLVPLWAASRRIFANYWPVGFFFLIAHVSFYGFAVNGIRNGMAMSLFTLAITMKGWRSALLMALAVGFHASLIMPVMVYLLVSERIKVKWALLFWIFCLLLSAAVPGVSTFLATSLPGDERLVQYAAVGDQYAEQFSSTGFRWDFVLYSVFPIMLAMFFHLQGKRFDAWYTRLFNTYVITNAAWLLLMRLPFSNRFAYLSWGIMGLVCAYPLVKWKLFKQQQIVCVLLLFIFFGFSYFYQL